MNEIREEIKRLEKELSDLKKMYARKSLRQYLDNDAFSISPIGCLNHIAKAKDGKRVYHLSPYSENVPIYDLAKHLFKYRRIDELSLDEINEVAAFCNEIIPIYNKYAVNKYIVNFNRQRFDEAYQDIIDYLTENKPGAVSCWKNSWSNDLEYTLKWREELSNEETVVNIHR